MSFNFVIPEMNIGGEGTPTLQFYRRGFNLGNGTSPSWQDIILSGNTALTLTNALANGLNYLKLFGGCEQRNLPSGYTQVNYVTNTAPTWLDTGVKFDFSKNYEIELRVRSTSGSWYILQARGDGSAYIYGISGSQNNNTIILGFNGSNISTSQVSRINGNIYYVKGTINNGNLTLYVKDETADTEETVTGTYIVATGKSVNIGLFGNLAQQFVGIDSDVYFARIKEDNNYILNYVSCRQGATAGFYDKASNTFKTTTDLVADGNTVPTPTTPIDIVCNNGVVKYGYKSVNMFDKNSTLEDGEIWGTDGNIQPLSGYYGVNQIHVIGGHTYTRSGSHGSANYIKLSDGTWTSQSDNSNTITMPDNAVLWVFNNTTATSRDTMMVVEGTTLPSEYVPYKGYGIYTDGTTETVALNLIEETHEKWGVNASGVVVITNSVWGYIAKVEPNKTYYYKQIDGNVVIGFFTSKPELGSVTYNQSRTATNLGYFTTPNDNSIKYVLLRTTQGSYIYDQSATAEMLLAVGSYQDEQEVLSGSVTRNIGIKVLDGTENIYNGVGGVYWGISATYFPNIKMQTTGALLTTCWKEGSYSSSTGAYCSIAGTTYFAFNKASLPNASTSEDVKQWLADQYNAGTPVIIIYPLAEPTTETVTAQPLTTQAGTNIVEITQASIDNLGLEVSYKATV